MASPSPSLWRVAHLELAAMVVRDFLEPHDVKTLSVDLMARGPMILVDVDEEKWTRFARALAKSGAQEEKRTKHEHDDGDCYTHASLEFRGVTIRGHWKIPPMRGH